MKTLGQIAEEGWTAADEAGGSHEEMWEAAAQAVRAAVIEECATYTREAVRLVAALQRIAIGIENGESFSGTTCAEIAAEALGQINPKSIEPDTPHTP